MTIDLLRDFCLTLPGVTEDVKWEHNLCFSVGGKIFLITNPDDYPLSASFKARDEDFDELISYEHIVPAPYLARNKWVFVKDAEKFSLSEWKNFIRQSYDLVFSRLTRKVQQSISGNP